MTLGSLFDGISGFPLAAKLVGIETKWISEIDSYCLKLSKQNFPSAIQYGNIKELYSPEPVDIISGGFPCQDISISGGGKGITGERSGLYIEMLRIVDEIRPPYVVIENSPELLKKGFEKILYPLSEIGYNVEWQCVSGFMFGSQQDRERVYIIAYSQNVGIQGSPKEQIFWKQILSKPIERVSPGWRTRRDIPQPRNYRSTNELPNLVDRIKGLGNSIIPPIAIEIFKAIKEIEKLNQ